MITTDVILFNDCGCEIARESVTSCRTVDDIVASWILYPGDRIEVEEVIVEM